MGSAWRESGAGASSTEAHCARIFTKYRGTIRVKNAQAAVANLTRTIGTALDLSDKKGFHATTLREPARLGLSMGALYTYFVSKPIQLPMILGGLGGRRTEKREALR